MEEVLQNFLYLAEGVIWKKKKKKGGKYMFTFKECVN